ncbi:MarR family winged helix-turn-helix transcriptional regulator [Streptomyces sp. NPDC058623]|uniref:MarR family winged helix-turn-helix transcriptional regulator n=1 Tax=Streptomyces sp. NPDC058623 TaxID=3346563 RepID=UPI0036632546
MHEHERRTDPCGARTGTGQLHRTPDPARREGSHRPLVPACLPEDHLQRFAVLNALSRDPGIDQRTLSQLTSLDRSTVNHMLRRLTDQHYVRQGRDQRDRRRTLLTLPDEGAELLDSLVGPAESINEQFLNSLPTTERAPAVLMLREIAALDDETSAGQTWESARCVGTVIPDLTRHSVC